MSDCAVSSPGASDRSSSSAALGTCRSRPLRPGAGPPCNHRALELSRGAACALLSDPARGGATARDLKSSMGSSLGMAVAAARSWLSRLDRRIFRGERGRRIPAGQQPATGRAEPSSLRPQRAGSVCPAAAPFCPTPPVEGMRWARRNRRVPVRAAPSPAAPSHAGALFGLATDLVVGSFDVWSLVAALPRRRKARPPPRA